MSVNFSQHDVNMHESKMSSKKRVSQPEGAFEGRESVLHEKISDSCRRYRWPFFHGSMAHRQMRTLGEPDFTILADNGKVFFIEVKTKSGKLSPEQLALKVWAEGLGHIIHTVRSYDEFLSVVGQ